jgi:hypothetical protein
MIPGDVRCATALALACATVFACKTDASRAVVAEAQSPHATQEQQPPAAVTSALDAGARAVSVTRLPSGVTYWRDLLIQFTREKDPAMAHLFTAAYLGSHLCFQETPEPTRALLTPAEVAATLGPRNLPRLRRLLACGEVLAKVLQSPRVVVIRFPAPGGLVDVRFADLGLNEMPRELGFVPHTVSGLPGTCQPDDAGGCAFESVHVGTRWMFGRAVAIEVMARRVAGVDTDDSDRISRALEASLAVLDEGAVQRYVSFGSKPPSAVMSEGLGAMLGTYSVRLPSPFKEDLDAAASRAIAWGYAWDSPSAKEVHAAFALAADSEDGAQALVTALNEVTHRSSNAEMTGASGLLQRALVALKPVQRGRAVLLEVRQGLRPGETLGGETRDLSQETRKPSVSRVLQAVLDGRPPPQDDVEKLGHGVAPTVASPGP